LEQQSSEITSLPASRACNLLLVQARFNAHSFWNFSEACKLVGAQYPTPPLGLITVAAMLPKHWNVRLVNRNTEELTDEHIAWADVVMTGGMMTQQIDTLRLVDLFHKHGKPVVVGGPDPTSSPHIYEKADFRVLGEVEPVINQFVEAWESGQRNGTITAEKFQADVTQTPIPRFDLLKFEHYLFIGVQYSRGCPFTCEFCDIIELYGRVPRTKTPPQMLAELQALYDLGYRGHVDFVDDNLIGNRKNLRIFLPELIAWQESHGYPFEFSTEASINLSDDAELLVLLKKANFFVIFVGIESPDPATLILTKKKQNTKRNLAESVHRIYSAGIFVNAGFILGFDTEKGPVGDAMADFIEEAAIPMAMVGLLYACPNTQLTLRLEKEGRLHKNNGVMEQEAGDQCTLGCNFDTLRPMREVLLDYRRVLEKVFDPVAYARRIKRLTDMLDRSGRPKELAAGDIRRSVNPFELLHKIINAVPEAREPLWDAFRHCATTNPAALTHVVTIMAFYAHLGPFSRYVIGQLDRRLAELDAEAESTLIGHNQAPHRASVAVMM
jgi:radical SAM superfamily enzyme YgiQ (UPF0313 family)